MSRIEKLFTPPFVVGFGLAALLSIPGLHILFFFILPAGAFLAIKFDVRLHPEKAERLLPSAWLTGLKTAAFAALFMMFIETLVTFIFKTNNIVLFLPEAVRIIKELGLPESEQSIKILEDISTQIKIHGFSFTYTIVYFLSNLITNSIFASIGAIIFVMHNNQRQRS